MDYYATYELIIQSLYGKIGLGNEKNRLNQLVRQLRRDKLVQTPDLTISNVRHKGYKLVVKSELITNE